MIFQSAFNVAVYAPDVASTNKNSSANASVIKVLTQIEAFVRDSLLSKDSGAEYLTPQPKLRLISAGQSEIEAYCAKSPAIGAWELVPVPDVDREADAPSGLSPMRCDLLLAQADLLIVASPSSPCCATAWLVRAASERAVPVVRIRDAMISAGDHDADWQASLRAEVARLMRLGNATSGRSRRTEASAAEVRVFLETAQPSFLAHRLYRRFENLIAVEFRRSPGPAADRLEVAGRHDGASDFEALRIDLAPHLRHADDLAVAYAAIYRSAVILRVLLAVVAIVGLFLAFYIPGFLKAFHARSMQIVVLHRSGYVVEFLAILGIISISGLSERMDWQRRFAAYRYIAEHLRQMPLRALAGARPQERSSSSSQPGWPTWYLRLVARAFMPPIAVATPHRLRANKASVLHFIADQIGFFEARARKFEVISRRLEASTLACYWLGVLCVLARLSSSLYFADASLVELFFGMGCLIFLSLAPCFAAFRSYGEYPKLARRYGTTAAVLRTAYRRMTGDEQSLADFTLSCRAVSSLMLGEFEDWSDLFAGQQISKM